MSALVLLCAGRALIFSPQANSSKLSHTTTLSPTMDTVLLGLGIAPGSLEAPLKFVQDSGSPKVNRPLAYGLFLLGPAGAVMLRPFADIYDCPKLPRTPSSMAWDKLRDQSRDSAHPLCFGMIPAPPRLTGR